MSLSAELPALLCHVFSGASSGPAEGLPAVSVLGAVALSMLVIAAPGGLVPAPMSTSMMMVCPATTDGIRGSFGAGAGTAPPGELRASCPDGAAATEATGGVAGGLDPSVKGADIVVGAMLAWSATGGSLAPCGWRGAVAGAGAGTKARCRGCAVDGALAGATAAGVGRPAALARGPTIAVGSIAAAGTVPAEALTGAGAGAPAVLKVAPGTGVLSALGADMLPLAEACPVPGEAVAVGTAEVAREAGPSPTLLFPAVQPAAARHGELVVVLDDVFACRTGRAAMISAGCVTAGSAVATSAAVAAGRGSLLGCPTAPGATCCQPRGAWAAGAAAGAVLLMPPCTVPATRGMVLLGIGAWMMRPGCAWLVSGSGTVVVPLMG